MDQYNALMKQHVGFLQDLLCYIIYVLSMQSTSIGELGIDMCGDAD
jgi:hypothetical protein